MATENAEKENFEFREEDDGSVAVDLPKELAPEGSKSDQEGGSTSHDDESDHPDDTEAVRAARRARRKAKRELARTSNAEKDTRLTLLQRENEEMRQRLSNVERRTQGAELAGVSKSLDDAMVRYEYAKMKLSEATASQDGDAAVQAQEDMYAARKEVENLSEYKRRQEQNSQQPQVKAPNSLVQKNALVWMERNNWYKPDGTDVDSKIAKTIDEQLSKDGYDPQDPDYWDELDNRLQNHLPHRYNKDSNEGHARRTPRNTVGSSGRESSTSFGGTNRTFTLSPEQVRTMKDAGYWDDPEKRNRMIKRYAEHARNNQNRSN